MSDERKFAIGRRRQPTRPQRTRRHGRLAGRRSPARSHSVAPRRRSWRTPTSAGPAPAGGRRAWRRAARGSGRRRRSTRRAGSARPVPLYGSSDAPQRLGQRRCPGGEGDVRAHRSATWPHVIAGSRPAAADRRPGGRRRRPPHRPAGLGARQPEGRPAATARRPRPRPAARSDVGRRAHSPLTNSSRSCCASAVLAATSTPSCRPMRAACSIAAAAASPRPDRPARSPHRAPAATTGSRAAACARPILAMRVADGGHVGHRPVHPRLARAEQQRRRLGRQVAGRSGEAPQLVERSPSRTPGRCRRASPPGPGRPGSARGGRASPPTPPRPVAGGTPRRPPHRG